MRDKCKDELTFKIREIARDRKLKSFGDVLLNYIISVYNFQIRGEIKGTKIDNKYLRNVVVRSKLREHLPSRMNRKNLGNAYEAIIAYANLILGIKTEEMIKILCKEENLEEGLKNLIDELVSKIAKK